MRRSNGYLVAILALMLLTNSSVMAAPISSGYSTEHFYRECSIVDVFGVQTRCSGANVDGWSLPTQFTAFSTTGTAMSNDPASAQLVFDRGHNPANVGVAQSAARAPTDTNLYPELAASSTSNPTTRMATVTTGIERYTNTSDTAIDLNLTGRIDGFIDKETTIYSEVDRLGNTVTAETIVVANLLLFTTTGATIETDAARPPGREGLDPFWNALCLRQLTTVGFNGGCAANVSRIYESQQLFSAAGSFDINFDPAGSFLTLNPGESVWVGASLATVALNGGTANAASTLRTSLIDPLSGRELTPLDGLRAASVPAPGAIGLLLVALLGLGARRAGRAHD